jgi:hypothetical protein
MRINVLSYFKLVIVSLLVVLTSLQGCDDGMKEYVALPPDSCFLALEGNKFDTAYMFVNYMDPGATVNKYLNGMITCPENIIWANVSGSVNTNIPGKYILRYSANDSLGNPLAPLSRTVNVVENSSSFLSGLYKVACTCTAISGSNKPIITSENYTAVVNPASGRGHFQLITLNIGAEHVIPQASLSGTAIGVGYFSANYHYPNCTSSGTLSPSKNTFTIETKFQRYSPNTIFYCKNVYSKLLTIKESDASNKK